jgi:hypothetical protein
MCGLNRHQPTAANKDLVNEVLSGILADDVFPCEEGKLVRGRVPTRIDTAGGAGFRRFWALIVSLISPKSIPRLE